MFLWVLIKYVFFNLYLEFFMINFFYKFFMNIFIFWFGDINFDGIVFKKIVVCWYWKEKSFDKGLGVYK